MWSQIVCQISEKDNKMFQELYNDLYVHLLSIFNASIFFLMQCDVDVPYIVPQEYRDISRQLPKPRGLKEAPASSNHDNTALRSR